MEPSHRIWPWTAGAFAALCIVISLYFFADRVLGPQIDVSAAIENGKVVFDIPFSGVNGILGFQVFDGEEAVWKISTSYEQGHRIVYGVLPTGGNMDARQSVPPVGITVPDIRGKTVTVRVQYQYDRSLTPCAGELEKTIVVP